MTYERRQHERFSLDQCVTLSFGREDFIDAKGLNLSRGGLFFHSSAVLDNYEKIFVMIDVDAGTIKAEGLVVHSVPNAGGFDYGLRFTDIAAEYKDVLDAYCKIDERNCAGRDRSLAP